MSLSPLLKYWLHYARSLTTTTPEPSSPEGPKCRRPSRDLGPRLHRRLRSELRGYRSYLPVTILPHHHRCKFGMDELTHAVQEAERELIVLFDDVKVFTRSYTAPDNSMRASLLSQIEALSDRFYLWEKQFCDAPVTRTETEPEPEPEPKPGAEAESASLNPPAAASSQVLSHSLHLKMRIVSLTC